MTPSRREVRVGEGFFRRLDEQLGPGRGPSGEPSATDFLVRELPDVVERFATDFDSLPEAVAGFSGGRMLVARGLLVRAFAVYGLLIDDNAIELIGINLDMDLDH